MFVGIKIYGIIISFPNTLKMFIEIQMYGIILSFPDLHMKMKLSIYRFIINYIMSRSVSDGNEIVPSGRDQHC